MPATAISCSSALVAAVSDTSSASSHVPQLSETMWTCSAPWRLRIASSMRGHRVGAGRDEREDAVEARRLACQHLLVERDLVAAARCWSLPPLTLTLVTGTEVP